MFKRYLMLSFCDTPTSTVLAGLLLEKGKPLCQDHLIPTLSIILLTQTHVCGLFRSARQTSSHRFEIPACLFEAA
jgi:hypothetical protein